MIKQNEMEVGNNMLLVSQVSFHKAILRDVMGEEKFTFHFFFMIHVMTLVVTVF